MRIITNSKYNAHTEPLFKYLRIIKIKDLFDIQCLKFWYKFVNKLLPEYFKDMFRFNHELYEIGTRNRNNLHLFPTRTAGAQNVLRHAIPKLLLEYPVSIIEKVRTHSIESFISRLVQFILDRYEYVCTVADCYICNNTIERPFGLMQQ